MHGLLPVGDHNADAGRVVLEQVRAPLCKQEPRVAWVFPARRKVLLEVPHPGSGFALGGALVKSRGAVHRSGKQLVLLEGLWPLAAVEPRWTFTKQGVAQVA